MNLILDSVPADKLQGMNEDWYGKEPPGNWFTNTLIPVAFASIPAATLLYALIMWFVKHR